ncbi:unnamed protein product [Darwinula stevensoni]|uniref:Signal-induced proliferation-associated 1-like protein 1 n=1 Tax=Darwinula stevensoni TaxID=69355 RepID=A0A7R8X6I6_9CRUS|nr:unnamed protein product [Darwinula stevensoni]CAG0881328.1 unnamed protein product [Darwinula stevensoni]
MSVDDLRMNPNYLAYSPMKRKEANGSVPIGNGDTSGLSASSRDKENNHHHLSLASRPKHGHKHLPFGLPVARTSLHERIGRRSSAAPSINRPNLQNLKRVEASAHVIVNNYVHVPRGGGDNNQAVGNMYRSNSSLDLEDDVEVERGAVSITPATTCSTYKREYGSHGSIDVLANEGLNSAGPSRSSTVPSDVPSFLRDKSDSLPSSSISGPNTSATCGGNETPSPKPKSKFYRLWEPRGEREKPNKQKKHSVSEPSIFKKLMGSKSVVSNATTEPPSWTGDRVSLSASSTGTPSLDSLSMPNQNMEGMDDRWRRKVFAHYDCQSVVANLSYAARLRGMLAKRRNTTTGASAASVGSARPGISYNGNCPTSDPSPETITETDYGDGKSNDLVLSCPYFRNELGGEPQRIVGLTRESSRTGSVKVEGWRRDEQHRLPWPASLSELEPPQGRDTLWRHGTCSLSQNPFCIQNMDRGAHYYAKYFYGEDHQNWFGLDESLGPVAISFKREPIEELPSTNQTKAISCSSIQYQYRLLVRTSELMTLRGTILEEALPSIRAYGGSSSGAKDRLPVKEVLEIVAPELQLSCLRLGNSGQGTEEQLLKLDQQGLANHFKVGIMYCKAGQATEEEMYNNEEAGPAFVEFLEMMGEKVRLKGFDKYRAGLDNKTDSTGLYSVYAKHQSYEVMFHVSTMLPFTPNNRQQLLRKRYIGNDIVTIVFQEPGALPFTPKNIRSHYQHVFIIVRVMNPCTDKTRYSIVVSRFKDVPIFGPRIPEPACFPKSKAFAEFLLTKVINAELAAHRSEKFSTMATRTRQEYLKDLATNFITNIPIEPATKFSVLSFTNKKREKCPPRFIPDKRTRGGLSWLVQVEDSGHSQWIDCILAVSADTFALIEESSADVLFAIPCRCVLGWTTQTSAMRIFYHQGESVYISPRESDLDAAECMKHIILRLQNVTSGCETMELKLSRNSLGQLGFHVQHDGLVSDVEKYGSAWQAGLHSGSRLVEICKVLVVTSSHKQMVDLLKNSVTVAVTVIPPLEDGVPRKGCNSKACPYTLLNEEESYENVGEGEGMSRMGEADLHPSHSHPGSRTISRTPMPPAPASAASHFKRYERSVSPHSSGYGTGSSSKSFTTSLDRKLLEIGNGTLTSNSSEEHWYENEHMWGERERERDRDHERNCEVIGMTGTPPPPPLPARSTYPTPPVQLTPRRKENNMGVALLHAPRHHHQITSSSHAINEPRSYSNYVNAAHLTSSRYRDGSGNHNNNYQPWSASLHDLNKHLASLEDLSDYENEEEPHPRYEKFSERQSRSQMHLAGPSDSGRYLVPPDRRKKLFHKPGENASHECLVKSSSLPMDRLLGGDVGFSLPPTVTGAGDGHSTDTSSASDRLLGHRSEDELSSGSVSISGLCLKGNHLGQTHIPRELRAPSSSSSRTQSPRSVTEARLRPAAVTSRGSSARNSANLGGSSLQEDLLKLIDPDAINIEDLKSPSSDPQDDLNCLSAKDLQGKERNGVVPSLPSSSLSQSKVSGANGDVIVTMARPATVLSSGSSSPSYSQKASPEDYKRWSQELGIPMMRSKEFDWNSLVAVATEAMNQSRDEGHASHNHLWVDGFAEKIGLTLPSGSCSLGWMGSCPELQEKILSLEKALEQEQEQKQVLASELEQLRSANRRLQEESQTAAQQLKRFTQWFFATINKRTENGEIGPSPPSPPSPSSSLPSSALKATAAAART